MVKEFKTFAAFGKQVEKIIREYPHREHTFLNLVGKFIQNEAKGYIGHLQHIWPELAESTQEQKESLGYGDAMNDWQPLLRTGEMRDSITYTVQLHDVYIGSDSDILVYQEIGTVRIPPRPVLGLAMYENKRRLEKSIGSFVLAWITDTRAKGRIDD
ncbi:MAG: hypothetical protein KGJ07_00040 [Patescibacteria group bacterium]|nr:hypothetical protein [Patescibacteria group bacterium]